MALLVHGDMPRKDIPGVMLDWAKMTSVLLFIACAMIFAHVLTEQQIPQNRSKAVLAHHPTSWAFLLMVNAILWFARDFMELSAIPLVLAPLLDPIATGPAIVMVKNMEVGMITPPVSL
jgi:C4-dicarboxylate transporter DctM subunit